MHELPSLHWPFDVQQSAIAALVQVWAPVSHVSLVHTLVSAQSASTLQQFGIELLEQVLELVLQKSNVHASVSLHCALVVQQSATAAFVQTPVIMLQVSVVHASVSAQSPLFAQQFAIGVVAHVLVFRSHASIVQALPSSHCGSAVQHVEIVAFEHTPVWTLQVSAVHMSASAQSSSLSQQPTCGRLVQVRVNELQKSFVHVLPSLHCVFVVQQPAIGVLTHWPGLPIERLHESVVHAFMSLHWSTDVHVMAEMCSLRAGSWQPTSNTSVNAGKRQSRREIPMPPLRPAAIFGSRKCEFPFRQSPASVTHSVSSSHDIHRQDNTCSVPNTTDSRSHDSPWSYPCRCPSRRCMRAPAVVQRCSSSPGRTSLFRDIRHPRSQLGRLRRRRAHCCKPRRSHRRWSGCRPGLGRHRRAARSSHLHRRSSPYRRYRAVRHIGSASIPARS